MQKIKIALTIGTAETDWKGVAGDTLKISIEDFINPEIGKAMKNVETSIKTNRFAACAVKDECYLEKMKVDALSVIEATLPKVAVGKMLIAIG